MIRREPPPSRGQVIRSEFLRGLDQRLRQLEARPGVKPIRPEPGPEPDAPTASGGGTTIAQFTITGESSTTWTCTRDATGETEVTVIKPFEIQGGPGERTVSGEVQLLIPTYTIGATKIYAAQLEPEIGGQWFDLNVAGRAWSMKYIGPS